MLDPNLNIIPDNVRNIHLIAACGTGMAALACLLAEAGYRVTGSDKNVYPPMSDLLADNHIPVAEGFDGQNLDHGPDLVVVGNAVTKDNPEVARLKTLNLPYCSMPQAFNHFAAADKAVLLITGTHGKTTTASLLAWILASAGLAPSFFIGGLVRNFGRNFCLQKGRYMVIEGDEYDTAFFDKKSKFMHYRPDAAILTGIEFDHADIFADLDAVKQSFQAFLSRLSPDSRLFVFDGSQHAMALIPHCPGQVVRYGPGADSDWRLGTVSRQPPQTVFEVFKGDRLWGHFATTLTGRHNLYNILAVVALAAHLGLSPEVVGQGLAGFQGVRRRQEVRGVKNGITVMDDFAHHPTAVSETLQGLKPFYPEGRLIAVFEPRTNTSRRRIFQAEYAAAFEAADLVCVSPPPQPEKVPEAERFSVDQLVADLKKRGQPARAFEDAQAIVDYLRTRAVPGDLIVVMSNGGFDQIHEKLLEAL